jgi:hypothetical protein
MPSDINRRPTGSVRGGDRPGPRNGSLGPGDGHAPDGHAARSSSQERSWQGTQDARSGHGTQGRAPSDKPDVFLHVPDVHVGEIYLDVEDLDAHLSLQARLANLVQIVAGVHVHIGKVELDIKDVGAEALLKVRLENLYSILDRALTTIDRNPEILQDLLKTVDTAVGDVGGTARQAVQPGGAASELAGHVGEVGKQAFSPGGLATEAVGKVGGAAQEAVGPGGAVSESTSAVGRVAEGVGDTVSGTVGEAGQGVREATQRASDVAQESAADRPGRSRPTDEKRSARPHAAGLSSQPATAGPIRRAPASSAAARGRRLRRENSGASRRTRD